MTPTKEVAPNMTGAAPFMISMRSTSLRSSVGTAGLNVPPQGTPSTTSRKASNSCSPHNDGTLPAGPVSPPGVAATDLFIVAPTLRRPEATPPRAPSDPRARGRHVTIPILFSRCREYRTMRPRVRQDDIAATAHTKCRMSEMDSADGNGAMARASDRELGLIDAWWRAANYLSVGQIYLCDNPLLAEPLSPAHIKRMLLGHWGTTPGQNFIYAHLNRIIRAYGLNMIYISGPGHGGP